MSAYDSATPTVLTGMFGETYHAYTVTTAGPIYTVTFTCPTDPTPAEVAVAVITTPRNVALVEAADGRLDLTWRSDDGTALVSRYSLDRGATWNA